MIAHVAWAYLLLVLVETMPHIVLDDWKESDFVPAEQSLSSLSESGVEIAIVAVDACCWRM